MRAAEVRPLFDYLESRGIKQTWLAQRLHMSRQYLHCIKVGEFNAPEGFMEIACRELGITERDLARAANALVPPRRARKAS